MSIKHRNLEIRKTCNDFSVHVRYVLLPLSLKVLRHKERETHSFYSGFVIPPTTSRAHLPKASASKRKSTLPVQCLVSTLLTFLKFAKSFAHFCCVTSFTLASPVCHLGLLWHLWVTHLLRPHARQHLCSSLHLTNPYAEPKGSQPN